MYAPNAPQWPQAARSRFQVTRIAGRDEPDTPFLAVESPDSPSIGTENGRVQEAELADSNQTKSDRRLRSPRRRRHRGRVMVHDLPIVAVLHIGEAVAGRDRFGFTVLRVGERIVA